MYIASRGELSVEGLSRRAHRLRASRPLDDKASLSWGGEDTEEFVGMGPGATARQEVKAETAQTLAHQPRFSTAGELVTEGGTVPLQAHPPSPSRSRQGGETGSDMQRERPGKNMRQERERLVNCGSHWDGSVLRPRSPPLEGYYPSLWLQPDTLTACVLTSL